MLLAFVLVTVKPFSMCLITEKKNSRGPPVLQGKVNFARKKKKLLTPYRVLRFPFSQFPENYSSLQE